MNINLTLIAVAIAFAAFIWFCAKFIWPPLMKAIDDRQKNIADGLAAAERGKQDLAQAEARVTATVNEAKARHVDIDISQLKVQWTTLAANGNYCGLGTSRCWLRNEAHHGRGGLAGIFDFDAKVGGDARIRTFACFEIFRAHVDDFIWSAQKRFFSASTARAGKHERSR